MVRRADHSAYHRCSRQDHRAQHAVAVPNSHSSRPQPELRIGDRDARIDLLARQPLPQRPGTRDAILACFAVGASHTQLGRTPQPFVVDGKTWSPDDFVSLMNDLESRIFDQLPDETWFYPGHGNDSTLGAERLHLGERRARGW